MHPLLRMQSVRKAFGATQALKGVSLEVGGGEILALIGENGAGKSTLMKVLSGAIVPDSGSMELAGRPYSPQLPGEALEQGVGTVILGDARLEHPIQQALQGRGTVIR